VQQSVDPLVERLRELEQSINAVKHKRGEEPVRIVDAPNHLDEQARGEAEQVVVDKQLSAAATAATVGVLLAQGNEEEAVKLLEPAADEGDAMAAQTLGLIFERRGELDRALEMQRRAADQGDHMALYNLGRLLHDRGENDGALDALRRSDDLRAAQLIEQIAGN
jgi:TPR repeat protein